MFYKVLNSRKLKNQRALISCILIISFLTTFSSCTTTDTSYISPKKFETGTVGEITSIQLKNKFKIDCSDKFVKFENKSDTAGVIVITSKDTIAVTNMDRDYKIQWNEMRIPVGDVLKIQLENTEISVWKNALWGFGILVIGLGIAFVITMGNGFNQH